MSRRLVVLGFLGPKMDAGMTKDRWNRWRPTLSLGQQEDLVIDRLELLYASRYEKLFNRVRDDLISVSPETDVRGQILETRNPWDFEEVYGALYEFARTYPFDTEHEDYLLHITTGSHVAQICLFLLTETHHFPARLIQTAPSRKSRAGTYSIIDLDLARYDQIASRFEVEHREGVSLLKSGIETKDTRFNTQIDLIEKVAQLSSEPMLLTGPTGAGKSLLASRVFELRKHRHQLEGPFVEVNCATLRGDTAMSTLFGHTKGAFTGAATHRPGLLQTANGGVLFLDEIGELGLDEQAMLLRALEEKRFLPVGADSEVSSDFQLIAGTNRDLAARVASGSFREDLLARINLWTFELPGLRDRIADLEPNLRYELEQYSRRTGRRVTFNKEARTRYLTFGTSGEATWAGNFRDLNASVVRMATLADGGRITRTIVDAEVDRLRHQWTGVRPRSERERRLEDLLGDRADELDDFERVQLAYVVEACSRCHTLAEAGRRVFARSRLKKKNPNDADRIRKYLGKYGLSGSDVLSR